jgi:uncharacterized SAM-binding protein YcdF (DUF218 family)
MSFFIDKFLPLFVYPAGLASLLLLTALIFWQRRRFSRTLVWAAFAIIFLAGNRWVSMSLVRSLERQYPPLAAGTSADGIVLLGGGTDPLQPPRQMVETNGAGDRVYYTARLYRQGAAPRILVSGGNIDWQGEVATTPAEDMRDILVFTGVPADVIVLQGASANTAQDAQYSAELIRQQGWEKVILVTSAMHMPRSVWLFQQAGIQVIPAPTDYTITDQGWQDLFSTGWENILINLLPTSANLKSTTSAEKEYIGMLMNLLRR